MTKKKDPADLLKPGAKISAKTIELIDLVKNNLHMERLEIMALIWKRYPDYSEDQFRMLIWNYKLPVKPSPRRKGPAPLAPGRVKTKPKAAVRGSVVGYHGRSRTLSGYYEL